MLIRRMRKTGRQRAAAAIPALGNRWDPVAIDRWLAAQRGEAPPEPADWEQRLAARLMDAPKMGAPPR
jgi:hypothetical protein